MELFEHAGEDEDIGRTILDVQKMTVRHVQVDIGRQILRDGEQWVETMYRVPSASASALRIR